MEIDPRQFLGLAHCPVPWTKKNWQNTRAYNVIMFSQKDCGIATSVHFIGERGGTGLINYQAAAKMSEHSLNFEVCTGTRHQNCIKKQRVRETDCFQIY